MKTQITQIMEQVFRHRLHRLNLYCDKIIEIFLYVLIFALPFSPAIIEISATFIILAWIVKKVLRFQGVFTYLNIPIIVYLLATSLSVIFSSNFALSLKNFLTKNSEYIILYFIVAEFALDKRRLKNAIVIMLVATAMIVADCIFQYFLGFDFLRQRTLEAGRISASFNMPGDLAGYLTPMLCLTLSLCFLKLKRKISLSLRIGSVLLLSLLILSFARGAWIGFIVAVCFLGLVENKKIIYVTFAVLLILGVVMPHLLEAPDDILGRLKSIVAFSNSNDLDRRTIWQAAMLMIRDRPLFGHGLSTFMGIFPSYGKDYYYLRYGIIPYAHNCYLQIAAETGIVGLVSFLMLIGTFFFYTIASLPKIKDRFYHVVLSGISAGIIATLVHSAVDTNLYSLQLSVLFWLMLGLNAALLRLEIEDFEPGQAARAGS